MVGHRLELSRTEVEGQALNQLKSEKQPRVNKEALEQIARKLLENPQCQHRWVPDFLEMMLYVNCLRIIFQLLDKLAHSIQVTLCGHALCLDFRPVLVESGLRAATRAGHLETASAFGGEETKVIVDTLVDETMAEAADMGMLAYVPGYKTFVRSLYGILYSLIIGIIDDLLRQGDIDILSSRIRVGLVVDIDELRKAAVPHYARVADTYTEESEEDRLRQELIMAKNDVQHLRRELMRLRQASYAKDVGNT